MSSLDAVAIVLDVGRSMDYQADASSATALSLAKDTLNVYLQRKIFSKSDDHVSLFTYGSDDTANELATDSEYQQISLERPLKPADWELCQFITSEIQATNNQGDLFEAMVVASTYLLKETSDPTDAKLKKKFAAGRKIIMVVSNLDNSIKMSEKQMEKVVEGFKDKIEVHFIGSAANDDDEDDQPSTSTDRGAADNQGGHSKPKTADQIKCERVVEVMREQLDANAYNFRAALLAMTNFDSKKKSSMAWNVDLTITSQMKIPISGYKLVTREALPSAKRCILSDQTQSVEKKFDTFIPDQTETEVDHEDIVKGYKYGTDIVPFSDEDMANMKYTAGEKCLDLIGFTKAENIYPHYFTGRDTMLITAQKADPTAAEALSSLIKALFEKEAVCIVRRAYNKASAPSLGVLVPIIKEEAEYLHYMEIAFMEDLREFEFPSMPINGDSEVDKNYPSDDLLNAVDNLITDMDVTPQSASQNEDDEQETEIMGPGTVPHPTLQRLFQVLSARAIDSRCRIPELSAHLTELLETSVEDKVSTESKSKLKRLAALEKVEIKKLKKDSNLYKESDMNPDNKANGDGDKDSTDFKLQDFSDGPLLSIGTTNPVQDFQSLISQSKNTVFKEMKERILQLLEDSVGDSLFNKTLQCIICMRQEAIKSNQLVNIQVFNEMLDQVKQLTQKIHSTFANHLLREHIQVINDTDFGSDSLNADWNYYFSTLKSSGEVKQEAPSTSNNVEEDDMLDML